MKLQDIDDLCSLHYIANDMKAWKELSTNIVSKAVDLEIQNLTEARAKRKMSADHRARKEMNRLEEAGEPQAQSGGETIHVRQTPPSHTNPSSQEAGALTNGTSAPTTDQIRGNKRNFGDISQEHQPEVQANTRTRRRLNTTLEPQSLMRNLRRDETANVSETLFGRDG